jgi:hypothetical protein
MNEEEQKKYIERTQTLFLKMLERDVALIDVKTELSEKFDEIKNCYLPYWAYDVIVALTDEYGVNYRIAGEE